jgi:hypothetical protein
VGDGDGDGSTTSASSSGSTSSSGGGSSGGGSSSGSSSGSGSGGPVPDANAAEDATSGTRLKAAYYVGGDGAKQFAHWVDSARSNETCSFQTASDGVLRCLPQVVYAQFYSDAKCTQPIYQVASGCKPPTAYAMPYDVTTCSELAPRDLYPFTAPVTLSGVYYGSAGSCTAQGASGTYYGTGAAIPASSFQSAQLQVE